jgi:hypothetical protein
MTGIGGLALLVVFTTHAYSNWIDASEKDKLTGENVSLQAVRANSPIKQFGHSVKVELVIRCDNPFNDRKKYKSDDHYSAFLLFSEKVGVGEVLVRYLFDGGPPISRRFALQGRGRAIFLSTIREYDDFIQPLRNSSKLRVQLDLPWAGKPIVEFDTSGAKQAFSRIPCG